MIDFEASDALVMGVLVVMTVAVSYPTGYCKGESGVSFGCALAAGFGRSFLMIMAVATVVGALIARVELVQLREDSMWEMGVDSSSWGCMCTFCGGAEMVRYPDFRDWWWSNALAAGYAFPFLAPAFGLLALVPSVLATALGYNVGSRMRVEALMRDAGGSVV
jgi:hypothetical protein